MEDVLVFFSSRTCDGAMTVWIVMRFKGNSYTVDEVFDNEVAALDHKDDLTRKWALTEIVQKEVKSL